MKITFLWIGKTSEIWLREGISIYENRLKHYIPFTVDIISMNKNHSHQTIKKQKEIESEAILNHINPNDQVYLLDEHGWECSSGQLAGFLQQKMLSGTKNLVLVIGGPFGFSSHIYKRANGMISFSKLTFPHQMIRLLLMEQIYRAFTIIKGEKYHHK